MSDDEEMRGQGYIPEVAMKPAIWFSSFRVILLRANTLEAFLTVDGDDANEKKDDHANREHHEGGGAGLPAGLRGEDAASKAGGGSKSVKRAKDKNDAPECDCEADEVQSAEKAGEAVVHGEPLSPGKS